MLWDLVVVERFQITTAHYDLKRKNTQLSFSDDHFIGQLNSENLVLNGLLKMILLLKLHLRPIHTDRKEHFL